MEVDEHYANLRLAELYDLDSPWAEDTDFYIAAAGSEAIDVIDVGCGTGTLALGLADRGHRVVGVDPAPAMLDVARSKDADGRVRWQYGDAQTFRVDLMADLIVMTGHAFQTLLTDDDILDSLRNFKRHLKPNGRAIFETRNPAIDWQVRWRTESVWQLPEGAVRQVRSPITIDGELVSFAHDWHFADGTKLTSSSTLRFAPETTVRRLAEQAGLAIDTVFGDWTGGPFDAARSDEMIFVLEAR